MRPIALLMTEHRTIELVLDALSQWAVQLERGEDPPLADLPGFVSWLRGYADAGHHGKEEEILFRRLVEAGMPEDDGPIAMMLQQHEEGRGLVDVLAQVAEQRAPLSGEERRRGVRAANDFADLLRSHIHAEDEVLYPMALEHLPSSAWAVMSDEFDAFDAANAKPRAALEALAADLVTRYARPAVARLE